MRGPRQTRRDDQHSTASSTPHKKRRPRSGWAGLRGRGGGSGQGEPSRTQISPRTAQKRKALCRAEYRKGHTTRAQARRGGAAAAGTGSGGPNGAARGAAPRADTRRRDDGHLRGVHDQRGDAAVEISHAGQTTNGRAQDKRGVRRGRHTDGTGERNVTRNRKKPVDACRRGNLGQGGQRR